MGSLFSLLSEELMIKILEELPLKLLCRLRAVYKSWERLLTSRLLVPHLCRQPFHLFLQHRHGYDVTTLFGFGRVTTLFGFGFDLSRKVAYEEIQFHHAGISCFTCGDGIICCLKLSEPDLLAIANPLTEEDLFPLPKLELIVLNFGFHVDPITRNFKVLARTGTHGYQYINAFWIFDSSKWNWRLLKDQLPDVTMRHREPLV
ncbi:uncharacterized protein LOC18443268 [Amborella trichopoda]|uniref:F-box domain-containing protein n=1 Tax=Amborella trichopoda TaxID=13333 RepID=U5CXW0_AMBTC|nr:uncharacterized protein LOC18443268 [Amborella trichopoda]ERN14989.1 hypothetical protein AMTR_s00032p00223620 [Amborella trichopoda]|eukprot:XP_006853522.1 uncharacterized protein LOC18443268 [Amborella trichopoda]